MRENIKRMPRYAVNEAMNCPSVTRKKDSLYCIWLCRCNAKLLIKSVHGIIPLARTTLFSALAIAIRPRISSAGGPEDLQRNALQGLRARDVAAVDAQGHVLHGREGQQLRHAPDGVREERQGDHAAR